MRRKGCLVGVATEPLGPGQLTVAICPWPPLPDTSTYFSPTLDTSVERRDSLLFIYEVSQPSNHTWEPALSNGIWACFRKEAIGKEASVPPAIQAPRDKARINGFIHTFVDFLSTL